MGRWYLRQLREAVETPVFVAWENASGVAEGAVAGSGLVVYVNPELQRLRVLVEAARGRLAELEADFTVEKVQVEAMKARLFAKLRGHFQRRDQWRDIIRYRRKYLDMLVRQGEEEAAQVQEEYRQASAQTEQDYEETAAAMAQKKELSVEEAGEISRLWRKLVRLYHPDRFAQEPEKQETYHRLTAAINQAKESGDLATLRMIADDPHGFILRQGWAALDFREEDRIAQLQKLWESIELEIIRVLEAVNALRESPDFELLKLTNRTPEFFDETVSLHIESLEAELARLKAEADGLAGEIEELTGEAATGI